MSWSRLSRGRRGLDDSVSEATEAAGKGGEERDPEQGKNAEENTGEVESGLEADGDDCAGADSSSHGGSRFTQLLVLGLLPVVAMAGTAVAGYLKYESTVARQTQSAAIESVQAAKDGTVQMLSYRADSVQQDLDAARNRLTGPFRDDYTRLTNDVVIPGAEQKKISAVASVPAASSVSASPDHAVVLVFVDQNITIGSDPPSSSSSTVRVSLDKNDDKWLITAFEPI